MAKRYRVVVTDFLTEAGVEGPVLGDLADVVLARAHSEQELAKALEEPTDAMILYHDIERVGEATFGRVPGCRVIVRAGVGYNNVDLEAAGKQGVLVCNVPDYGTEEVADHSMLLLLAAARRLIACHDGMRTGEWDYLLSGPAPRLRGKTLGLVGCGRIGTAMAYRARAFGLDVVFYDPLVVPGYEKAIGVRRVTDLGRLMEQSRFVSIHCYLDEKTRHLVGREALARMPKGGFLINTSRGPIVDQEAVVEALESGHLAGAGLDVYEHEPLEDERLRGHPRVVLTPHSAFYSVEGFEELRRKAAEEVRRLLMGEPPLNPVNRHCLVPRP